MKVHFALTMDCGHTQLTYAEYDPSESADYWINSRTYCTQCHAVRTVKAYAPEPRSPEDNM